MLRRERVAKRTTSTGGGSTAARTASSDTGATTAPTPGSPAAVLAESRGTGLRVRPHRPMRALVGAFLVVAAVVAALALYTSLGDKTEVLAVTRNVLAGEQITSADLRVVSISSDDDIPTVSADLRAEIVGQYAKVRLAAGALLVSDSVQPRPLVDPERVLMSVEVPAGQVPVGLREQSRLVLVVIPDPAAGGSASPVLVEATVAAVPRNLAEVVNGDGGGVVALSVEVPTHFVAVVGSAGSVSVGVLDPAAAFPGSAAAPDADSTVGSTPNSDPAAADGVPVDSAGAEAPATTVATVTNAEPTAAVPASEVDG